jgi:predicted amidophosphoribosyltransferase
LKADSAPTCAAHPQLSALLAQGLTTIANERPEHTLILDAYPCSSADREPPLRQLARSLLAADPSLAARVSLKPLLTRAHTVQQRSSVSLAERAALEFEEMNSLRATSAMTQAEAGPRVFILIDDVITTGLSLAAGELAPTYPVPVSLAVTVGCKQACS